MEGKWEGRIPVGGLAWKTDDRRLGDAFRRFGRVVDAQVICNKETGASRSFGFVTFYNQWVVDNAIREMNFQELNSRIIEVYNAETWMNTRRNTHDTRYGGRGSGQGHYRGGHHKGRGDASHPGICFACGLHGHWAHDSHSASGGYCNVPNY